MSKRVMCTHQRTALTTHLTSRAKFVKIKEANAPAQEENVWLHNPETLLEEKTAASLNIPAVRDFQIVHTYSYLVRSQTKNEYQLHDPH